FNGMDSLAGGTLLTGTDSAVNLRASVDAARAALRLAGVGVDPEDAGGPGLDERRRAEVADDCRTLLVLLADGTARQTPGAGGCPRALDLLAGVLRLGPPTQACHLRRALFLDRLGDEAGAARERAAAESLPPATALDYFLLGDLHYKRGEWREA